MAIDFSNALKLTVSATRPMPVLPIGSYVAKVKPYKERSITRDGNTQQIIAFPLQILMPSEDVDAEQLAAFKAEADFSSVNLSKDIFLADSDVMEIALHPVHRFLAEICKVDVSDENLSFGEALARANGTTILIHIAHKMSKDGKNVIMNIDSVAANVE